MPVSTESRNRMCRSITISFRYPSIKVTLEVFLFGVMQALLKNCYATDHLSKLCQVMGDECNVLYTNREIKGTGVLLMVIK